MNVFIPSAKDPNPYLDEIILHSKCKFIFDKFTNYQASYKIVNIHWPESIFNWTEPTNEDLILLEQEIKKWKINSKIVYTFHDERHHFGMTPNYAQLFDLIEKNADVFIHLGEFSKRKIVEKFPEAIHEIIPHPLYSNYFKKTEKYEARKKLNIDSEALVIIAPGRIRSVKERNLVLKAFRSISKKNKVLLSNNMLSFNFQGDFKGRVRIKKIFDFNDYKRKIMEKKYLPPEFVFNYQFTETEELSIMFSAADIVFIPRIDTLNSGNVFLGFTFKKVVVGPAIGNIKNTLLEFGFPVFDPYSYNAVKRSINEGVRNFQEDTQLYNEMILKKYYPKAVAEKMDSLFQKL